ncbi:hypothetical protein [uncultured Thalassospira sp.]|uniref:hypothetical protein n=1 Tax=uncultured Thalassospira sp. TaxID=404382 RepID=UPI0025893497|nr:hypothetical protein [uncultured Thalassospira sp.]
MKLQYKVLCIDDNLSRLKRVKEEFEDLNDDVGIQVTYEDVDASIKARETPDEFKDRIVADIALKFNSGIGPYEMILVDLHFGPTISGREVFNGGDVINLIRDSHNLYRPIVFYSAGDPESRENAIAQLDETAKAAGVFGKSVFTVPMDELNNLLSSIAKEMHDEEHKINHVRGLLMDQVSELDACIIKAISDERLWDAVAEGKRDKVVKEFKERMENQYKQLGSVYKATKDLQYEAIKEYILKNPMSVNTFTKSKVLREMLRHNVEHAGRGKVLSEGINTGEKCIINVRNAYGHQVASELRENHSVAKCKMIRIETRRQVKNIKDVLGI